MRRYNFCLMLAATACLCLVSSSSAASPSGLKLSIVISSDFSTVTYSVKNISSSTVAAGNLVAFASSGGNPKHYYTPVKLKMNGLKAPHRFGNIRRTVLPALKPQQSVKFTVFYRLQDVRLPRTCHFGSFQEAKQLVYKCNN